MNSSLLTKLIVIFIIFTTVIILRKTKIAKQHSLNTGILSIGISGILVFLLNYFIFCNTLKKSLIEALLVSLILSIPLLSDYTKNRKN